MRKRKNKKEVIEELKLTKDVLDIKRKLDRAQEKLDFLREGFIPIEKEYLSMSSEINYLEKRIVKLMDILK